MNALTRLWQWWVDLVDKLPKAAPPPPLTLSGLRWNLEVRRPGGKDIRAGARLHLTNQQCMELLVILNKLEGRT